MKASKTMNVWLWIAQGLLAAALLLTGFMKLFQPQALPFPWVKELPQLVVLTGVADILGGIGIILPAVLRIRPGLVVLAAYGIIALMAAAMVFHIARGEAASIGFNIFMTVVAGFVAWGRR